MSAARQHVYGWTQSPGSRFFASPLVLQISPASRSRIIKPQLLLITWQDNRTTTNVHVYDFETGEAHAVVSYADHRVDRAKGTVRRVD